MAVCGNALASIASATSARARPVTPPPHGFSRGCEPSKIVTRAPPRASTYAARAPAGPAPTIATSMRTSIIQEPNPENPVIHYTPMVEVEAGRFSDGVFQDVARAAKGVPALIAG